MELVETIQMSIYQSHNYRKDLSWLHFNNEPTVQKKQQVKDQQSSIPVLLLIYQFHVAARSTNPDMTLALHARPHGRFIEIQSNLRRMKLHVTNQSSNFLGISFRLH